MGQKQGKGKGGAVPAEADAPRNHHEAQQSNVERRPSAQPRALERRPSTQPGDGVPMVRRGSSQQAEDLNMYAKSSLAGGRKLSSASDMGMARHGSSQDALRRPSKTPEPVNEDMPQQRRTLFDHLVAFYFRNDNERLMNGDVDVDGICDWALSGGPDGIAALNERLRNKYGEDLDTFLINAAMPDSGDEGEDDDDEGGDDTEQQDTEIIADLPPPPPSSREASSELSHTAALERPAIPAARRRPTNNAAARFKVDENGQLAVPESEQLDYQPPVDLETQLRQFIESIDASRIDEVPRFLKLANENGLIALNSELLVSFGKDLKGNSLEDSSRRESSAENNIRKFGIGFDNKVLAEMQNHKLNHEDSGRVLLHADPETGACSRFRLDTESPIFGMCKCGQERAAHIKRQSVIRSGTLERKLAQRRASINVDAVKQQQQSPSVTEVTPPAGTPKGAQTTEKPPAPVALAKPPPPSAASIKPPAPSTTFVKPPVPSASSPNSSAPGNPANPSAPARKPTIPTSASSAKPPAPSGGAKFPAPTSASNPKPSAPAVNSGASVSKPPTPNAALSPRGANSGTVASSTATKVTSPPSNNGKPQPAWVKPQQQPLQTGSTAPKPPRPKSTRPKSTRKGPPANNTLERLAPGEKKSVPCSAETFQLDMSASEFGTCARCGWKKSEHVPGGKAGTSSNASTLESAQSKRPVSLRKDGPPEPCNNYKLDLTADTFGACVCGFARQAHKGQGSNTKVISKTLEKRWNEVKAIA